MGRSFQAESARPEELAAAFRLIFRYLDEDECEIRTSNALTLTSQNELDPAGVFVVRQGHALLGAMICQPAPGASGLVWPPQAVPGPEHIDVEDCLVRHACAWLRQHGARLGQALLAPQDVCLAAPLERNGFVYITSLDYLRHALELPRDMRHSGEQLTYETYKAADRALFHYTLMRTYEQTLDCPELNDVRTIDDIIAGHLAQGRHDPERWWLAFDAGRPVGTLLLTELPESARGTFPMWVWCAARGQGWGRQLVAKRLMKPGWAKRGS